jgi:hypothetical protein
MNGNTGDVAEFPVQAFDQGFAGSARHAGEPLAAATECERDWLQSTNENAQNRGKQQGGWP